MKNEVKLFVNHTKMIRTKKPLLKDIICWWSGGITSAVACNLAIELFGKDRCRVVMIDTHNEYEDTHRFKIDCEKWYGIPIESISRIGKDYQCIQDVWRRFNSLNVATGAICSSELKREVRIKFQNENKYTHQIFGFDIDEPKRAKSMTLNYPNSNGIYPLLLHGMSKTMCIDYIQNVGIEIPVAYKLNFHNNNCLQTGCVQGGIGYWQKIRREFPEKFEAMASIEHELTNSAKKPVTMNKDQSKVAKESGIFQVFLLPHPDYPNHKSLADMKDVPVKPLFDCNGFGCAINDLEPPNKTALEINFDT